MRLKPSEALRFLGAVAAAILLLGLLVLRVTSCAPVTPPGPAKAPEFATPGPPPPPPAPPVSIACNIPAWYAAAAVNSVSLRTMPWAPFRRNEIGWEIYAPMIAREIGTGCPPESAGFAGAYADWQAKQRIQPTGLVTEAEFQTLRNIVQMRRIFVRARGVCPPAGDEATLEWARTGEGYSGKAVALRPRAFAAYRQMAAAARAADPAIAADPRNLTIFSGYRSPTADAQRCTQDGNCDGIARAVCSPHRTGLAMDMYVGQAPGFGPDSTADPNRLFMSKTPTYRWLLANGYRYGFINYPFEPWHWEWTGEAP